MLICRTFFLLLLFIVFGCGGKYTQKQFDKGIDDAEKTARVGWISNEEHEKKVNAAKRTARVGWISNEEHEKKVDAAEKTARVGWISNEEHEKKVNAAKRTARVGWISNGEHEKKVDAAKRTARQGMVSKTEYDSVVDQLRNTQKEIATSKAKQTIELAKQINFFGFAVEEGSIPDEVVSYLDKAKRELKNAEQKLKYPYTAEESAEHAAKAFKIRTEIVYYSLIRYHYRLGEKYKNERGEKDKKQEAYQEAYKIAKQLFENTTEIDPKSPLFAETFYKLAKIAIDYYTDKKVTEAGEIYKLIKKYPSQERRVLNELRKLDGKVGD